MRSRRSSGRRRGDGPPEFLIDRSLSQVWLPAELHKAGLFVRTLAQVYGEQAAQEAEDADWLSLAGERGWVVLCKDDRIRRRPAELQALGTDPESRTAGCLVRRPGRPAVVRTVAG
jgi:hypothetical protein